MLAMILFGNRCIFQNRLCDPVHVAIEFNKLENHLFVRKCKGYFNSSEVSNLFAFPILNSIRLNRPANVLFSSYHVC